MLTVLWQTKKPWLAFVLKSKHVVNEHHIIRKSHDATWKKCPHMVHFIVTCDWFETNSQHQKHYWYSEGSKKKIVGVVVYWEK